MRMEVGGELEAYTLKRVRLISNGQSVPLILDLLYETAKEAVMKLAPALNTITTAKIAQQLSWPAM